MKKTIMTLLAATTLMLSSCLTTGMGTAPTASSNNNVLGNVFGAVLGQVLLGGMTYGQSGILGSRNYNAPSAAFTTRLSQRPEELLRLPTWPPRPGKQLQQHRYQPQQHLLLLPR